MPFDGNGTYTPPALPVFPAIPGTPINSNYYNTLITDIVTALNNTLTRDGQGKPSGSIDWNGQNLFNVAKLTIQANGTPQRGVLQSDPAVQNVLTAELLLKGAGSGLVPALRIESPTDAAATAYIAYNTAYTYTPTFNSGAKKTGFAGCVVQGGITIMDDNMYSAGMYDQGTGPGWLIRRDRFYNNMYTDFSFYPFGDNVLAVGGNTNRWTTIYLASSPIVTSDLREKDWLDDGVPDDLYAIGLDILGSIGSYQMKASVADKGLSDARIHWGVGAQTLVGIFAKHGKAEELLCRNAFFCHDEWEEREQDDMQNLVTYQESVEIEVPTSLTNSDGQPLMRREVIKVDREKPGTIVLPAGDRYAIRYDELSMFLLACTNRRQTEIEAKLEALLG